MPWQIDMVLDKEHPGHARKRRRLGRRRLATCAGDQHMRLAQRCHRGHGLGQRIRRQLAVNHFAQKKNSHQITPASSFSFAISSSTEPTLTPALRVAGSTVFTTLRRGLTSTP